MKTTLILTILLCAIALPHSHAAGPAVLSGIDVADNVVQEDPRARLKSLAEAVGEHDVQRSIAGAESSSDGTHYFRLIHSTHTWIERPPATATQDRPAPRKPPH